MRALFQSLLLLLAKGANRELVRQIQFLKIEAAILRGKLPKRIRLTPKERKRLVKFGKPLGKAVNQLISIVSPRTFLRWLQQEGNQRASTTRKSPGRPPQGNRISNSHDDKELGKPA